MSAPNYNQRFGGTFLNNDSTIVFNQNPAQSTGLKGSGIGFGGVSGQKRAPWARLGVAPPDMSKYVISPGFEPPPFGTAFPSVLYHSRFPFVTGSGIDGVPRIGNSSEQQLQIQTAITNSMPPERPPAVTKPFRFPSMLKKSDTATFQQWLPTPIHWTATSGEMPKSMDERTIACQVSSFMRGAYAFTNNPSGLPMGPSNSKPLVAGVPPLRGNGSGVTLVGFGMTLTLTPSTIQMMAPSAILNAHDATANTTTASLNQSLAQTSLNQQYRVSILAGDKKQMAAFHQQFLLSVGWSGYDWCPANLATNTSITGDTNNKVDIAGVLDPAMFLYDDFINPETDGSILRLNVPDCTLRIGGINEADILLIVTSPTGPVQFQCTLDLLAVECFFPSMAYPLEVNPKTHLWDVNLNCSASDMRPSYSSSFSSGMYWPLEWAKRLATPQYIVQLPGVYILTLMGIIPRDTWRMDTTDTRDTRGTVWDRPYKVPPASEAIAGGDPAIYYLGTKGKQYATAMAAGGQVMTMELGKRARKRGKVVKKGKYGPKLKAKPARKGLGDFNDMF